MLHAPVAPAPDAPAVVRSIGAEHQSGPRAGQTAQNRSRAPGRRTQSQSKCSSTAACASPIPAWAGARGGTIGEPTSEGGSSCTCAGRIAAGQALSRPTRAVSFCRPGAALIGTRQHGRPNPFRSGNIAAESRSQPRVPRFIRAIRARARRSGARARIRTQALARTGPLAAGRAGVRRARCLPARRRNMPQRGGNARRRR